MATANSDYAGDQKSGESPMSPKTDSIEPQCNTCGKKESELGSALKRCARCQTIRYCSKECQKTDWTYHKKQCGSQGSHNDSSSRSANASSTSTSGISFGAIQERRFFDNKSEEEAFASIIDSYRLRVEDEYTFMGNNRGIYGGEDPAEDFNEYLDKAEAMRVLPTWWDATKREACVRYGFNKANWSDLNCAVEKSDIIEHYKNSMMPMQLRMVAEMVEGSNVTGQPAGSGLRTFSALFG